MTSVIVRFRSQDARESFVRRAKQEWPELIGKTYQAKRRPDTVIEELSDEEVARLKELLQDLGTIYDDVKFEAMPPAELRF